MKTSEDPIRIMFPPQMLPLMREYCSKWILACCSSFGWLPRWPDGVGCGCSRMMQNLRGNRGNQTTTRHPHGSPGSSRDGRYAATCKTFRSMRTSAIPSALDFRGTGVHHEVRYCDADIINLCAAFQFKRFFRVFIYLPFGSNGTHVQ